VGTEVVPVLRDAIREKRIVDRVSRDGKGSPSSRRVRPLVIWNMPDGWMFTGWCELRRDFRTFRFDRITRIDPTEEHFEEGLTDGLKAFMELERCHARGE
jgi:predicted DNA-binding transcriptional regulator YafY